VRDEVVNELQRLAAGDASLKERIAKLKDGRLTLSPQEEKLFTDPAVRELLGSGGISGTLIARVSKPSEGLPAEIASNLERAHEVFAAKKYEQAAALYQQVIAAKPQEVSALLGLGYCQERMRRYQDAEATLKRCLQLDAENEMAMFYLGVTYFKQERWNESMASFEAGLKANPSNARARHYLGIIATKLSLIDRAEREFKLALAIDPDFGEAHFNLAVLYATWDPPRWPEARGAYALAVKKGVSPDVSLERLLQGSSGGSGAQ
jgi:tetratricopeptide (TPR) repeat protein